MSFTSRFTSGFGRSQVVQPQPQHTAPASDPPRQAPFSHSPVTLTHVQHPPSPPETISGLSELASESDLASTATAQGPLGRIPLGSQQNRQGTSIPLSTSRMRSSTLSHGGANGSGGGGVGGLAFGRGLDAGGRGANGVVPSDGLRRTKKNWLVVVVPPAVIPHSPPPSQVSGFAHGYGPPGHFSSGILLPLQSTLSAQLSLIAREFSLPSVGGVAIYLCLPTEAGGLKPRMTDEVWGMVWRGFLEDEEEHGLGGFPIAGRIEFDIDERKARWWSTWLEINSNATATNANRDSAPQSGARSTSHPSRASISAHDGMDTNVTTTGFSTQQQQDTHSGAGFTTQQPSPPSSISSSARHHTPSDSPSESISTHVDRKFLASLVTSAMVETAESGASSPSTSPRATRRRPLSLLARSSISIPAPSRPSMPTVLPSPARSNSLPSTTAPPTGNPFEFDIALSPSLTVPPLPLSRPHLAPAISSWPSTPASPDRLPSADLRDRMWSLTPDPRVFVFPARDGEGKNSKVEEPKRGRLIERDWEIKQRPFWMDSPVPTPAREKVHTIVEVNKVERIKYPVLDIYPGVYPNLRIYPTVTRTISRPATLEPRLGATAYGYPHNLSRIYPPTYPNFDLYLPLVPRMTPLNLPSRQQAPKPYPSNLSVIYPPVYPFFDLYPKMAPEIVSPPMWCCRTARLEFRYPRFELWRTVYPALEINPGYVNRVEGIVEKAVETTSGGETAKWTRIRVEFPSHLERHPTLDGSVSSSVPTSAHFDFLAPENAHSALIPFVLSPQFDLESPRNFHLADADDSEIDAQYIVYPRPFDVVPTEELSAVPDFTSPLPPSSTPAPILFSFPPLSQSDDLAVALGQLVVEAQHQSINTRGKFRIALSGGSLVRILAEALLGEEGVEWRNWEVFFVDERLVTLDDKECTAGAYWAELLSEVDVPSENIHFIKYECLEDSGKGQVEVTEDIARMIAEDYEKQVLRAFEAEGGGRVGPPSFDLVLLGMGEDGHTASLFPHSPLLNETDWYISPLLSSPKPPSARITFTLPLLNAARRITFVCTGASKRDALANVFDRGLGRDSVAKVPAGRVVCGGNPVVWLVDGEACEGVGYEVSRFWEEEDEEESE